MTLGVQAKFPGGNVAGVEIGQRDGIPEIRFAADPCGGAEAMWFYFRIDESTPDPARHTKLRLTWTMIDNVGGGTDSAVCVPATCIPGSTWSRLKQGEESRNADGLRELSWTIPHPAPSVEIAFCFPYGNAELDNLVEKTRDFWRSASVGISQGGRTIHRVYHQGTGAANQPGVFLLSRMHAGETPGSWVLDGFMRHWAASKKSGYCLWTIPFADPDGVEWGWYGRENIPHDLDRAFGNPPLRHESLVLQHELQRWKARCRPLLILDLHAPGAFERDGVYAYGSAAPSPGSAEEAKWANVIKNELRTEYAAADFLRQDSRPSRSSRPPFAAWARESLGVPVLSLQIPYGLIAGNPLSQKHYREIGQRIAQAVVKRG